MIGKRKRRNQGDEPIDAAEPLDPGAGAETDPATDPEAAEPVDAIDVEGDDPGPAEAVGPDAPDGDLVDPDISDPALTGPDAADGDEPALDGDEWTEDKPPVRGLWVVLGCLFLVIGLGAGAAALANGRASNDEGATATTTVPAGSSGSGAPSGEGDGATTTTAAVAPHWPVSVQGRPAAFGGVDGDPPPASADGLEAGFYLWQDFAGWHLWLVGGEDTEGTVEIRSDDAIASATPTGGAPFVAQDRNQLALARGDAGEPVVGVDFNPGFFAKTMVVTTSGGLPIHLGAQSIVGTEYLGLQLSTVS